MPAPDRPANAVEAKAPPRGQSIPFALSPPTGGDDCYVRLNADSLHDLTGPVNQIGTLVELLRKKCRSTVDEEAETLFGFAQNSTSRLQDLIAGLRTYMRVVSSPSPSRLCDINLLLAGVQASLQAEIEENQAVVTHDTLPEVYCEPNQISYAFSSLMGNAIQFRGRQRPEIHVSARAQEPGWVFSVRDNGIGIDPRLADRIFGLFKRAGSGEHHGAGVGLAITRQIVEQHGGRIWVESQPGSGATFFFSLRQAA
jgi:chemotaxis family two-component system sensor kinase Cph1